MLKVGDKIEHDTYGRGEITSIDKENNSYMIAFDKESEIVIHDVVDTQYHFEDNTRTEKTNFIRVYADEVIDLKWENSIRNRRYSNNCHSCGKLLSSQTHPYCTQCNWLLCECGSCKCNYTGKKL